MDYGGSYVSAVAAAAAAAAGSGHHFIHSACHFASVTSPSLQQQQQQQESGSGDDGCHSVASLSPLGGSVAAGSGGGYNPSGHHSTYTDLAPSASPPCVSPHSSSVGLHLYATQRYNSLASSGGGGGGGSVAVSGGHNSAAGSGSGSSSVRLLTSSASSSISNNNNIGASHLLPSAGSSLFGGSFHGNGLTSLNSSSSHCPLTSSVSSRVSSSSMTSNCAGGGSVPNGAGGGAGGASFFASPNALHFQGFNFELIFFFFFFFFFSFVDWQIQFYCLHSISDWLSFVKRKNFYLNGWGWLVLNGCVALQVDTGCIPIIRPSQRRWDRTISSSTDRIRTRSIRMLF